VTRAATCSHEGATCLTPRLYVSALEQQHANHVQVAPPGGAEQRTIACDAQRRPSCI
jgi:hypothetical protein